MSLIVDDDLLILMDTADILVEAGFRVHEAHNVQEALSQLAAHAGEITLLFTDVQMPGGRDGFDLARETAQRWPDIKVVVASGHLTPRPGDLPDGAVFIGKPFSPGVIYECLQKLLPEGQKPEPLKHRTAG